MANPVTDVVRPVLSLLEYAASACTAAGVASKVFTGTTYAGLAREIPTLLVESRGNPIVVVCYGGSRYGNAPRRIARVSLIVVQGHTRVAPGVHTALTAAGLVTAVLDDVIYQDTVGEDIITEKWKLMDEDVIDLDGLDTTAGVLLTFNVEDY